jgi:putative transcriptional regulator
MLKLKCERLTRGYTQIDLARFIKVTPEYIHYLENGHRSNPSWEVIKRLEQFFGIPASELLAESEDKRDHF